MLTTGDINAVTQLENRERLTNHDHHAKPLEHEPGSKTTRSSSRPGPVRKTLRSGHVFADGLRHGIVSWTGPGDLELPTRAGSRCRAPRRQGAGGRLHRGVLQPLDELTVAPDLAGALDRAARPAGRVGLDVDRVGAGVVTQAQRHHGRAERERFGGLVGLLPRVALVALVFLAMTDAVHTR